MQLTDYTGTFSDGLFPYLWWIIPLAAAAYLSKSMLLKHFFERFAVNTQAQCRLDAEHYYEFRNLDIRSNGRHEQIDYVYRASAFSLWPPPAVRDGFPAIAAVRSGGRNITNTKQISPIRC